jgi:P-type Ca2+ transporter type 2B
VWLASCDFCIRILAFCALLLFIVAIFTKSNGDALWQAISLLVAVLAVILIQAITDFRKERQFHELFSHKDEKNY